MALALERQADRVPAVLCAPGWYNPGLEYDDSMLPGILVVLVTVVATAVAAMNIVREKEIGTLEQLDVTPVTKIQFVAGKLLPFWIIALVDMALGLVVARLVFGVPMEGSLRLVRAATVVYLFAALGDAERGRRLIGVLGCGGCHVVPGVPGANGRVGPPLMYWARRNYIAGTLANTPEALVRFIIEPDAIEPGTAMPAVGASEPQALDIAAYLFTIR